MRIDHRRQQHAIGHGFFHTGSLRDSGEPFHYVYDCGAKRVRLLRERILAYRETLSERRAQGDAAIDLLVVSHFHADHVVGLDDLLTRARVDTVAVPYLEPEEVALLAARALSRDALDGDYLRFISEPAHWFDDRGARRVYVVKNDTDDGIVGPRESPKPPPAPERLVPDKWPLQAEQEPRSVGRYDHAEVRELGHSTPLSISRNGAWIWRFRMFCYTPNDARTRMATAMKRRFSDRPGPYTSAWLRELVQTKSGRARLIACYDEVAPAGLNWTSMSLHSGPATPPSAVTWSALYGGQHVGDHRWWDDEEGAAWLGTGDTELADAHVADRFYAHFFDGARPDVLTASVPHHGSIKNFNQALLERVDAPVLFATCPKESLKHPDAAVLGGVRELGQELLRVTVEDDTALRERLMIDIDDTQDSV